MILAKIKMYLRLGLGNLTILELNSLQKEIDQMIRTKADIMLAQQSGCYEPINDSQVYFREFTHPIELEAEEV